jgi:hypothetical protein
LPSLAPARPLAPGRVEVGVGSAAALMATNSARGARRALARTALSPAVVPWVSPRVGLPESNEIWALFSGGSTGLGARHAWVGESWALSVGLEGAWLNRETPHQAQTAALQPEWRANGWQASVPVVVGWQSDTNLVSLWAGVRGRFARFRATAEGGEGGTLDDRVAGGFAGLSVGVHPLWVRIELLAEYHNARLHSLRAGSSSLGLGPGNFEVFSLTPAGALAVRF